MLFLIAFSLVSILIALVYLLIVLDSLFLGNSLATSAAARKQVLQLIAKYRPAAKNLYDLGCAYGDFALALNRELPRLQVIAVDNNRLRIALAKIKKRLMNSPVNFHKENLFQINLKSAEIVYTYLPRALMPRLEEKLLAELPAGAVVITNSTYFPLWRPAEMLCLDDDRQKSAPIFVYVKVKKMFAETADIS